MKRTFYLRRTLPAHFHLRPVPKRLALPGDDKRLMARVRWQRREAARRRKASE